MTAHLIDFELNIRTDSLYSVNCLKVWYNKWKHNNFMSASNKQIANLDLIHQICEAKNNRVINFEFIRAHVGYY